MVKDDRVYLGHMLDTARKVLEKTSGVDRAQFDTDENPRLALAHLLQIIGEAASRLSLEFRQSRADIPWKAVIGMRHKIVHDYLNVDDDIVWLTATVEMGPLVTQLKNIVSPDEGRAP